MVRPTTKPTKREPTQDDLRVGLRIDRNALDEEIEGQADVFYRVAEAAALAASRRDEARALMDEAFMMAGAKARRRSGHDDERITEGRVKEVASKDKGYLQAVDGYLEAKKEADQMTAMREAYDMRGKMLRELAQLYIAGYYQVAGVGASRRGMDDAAAVQTRRALANSRVASGG